MNVGNLQLIEILRDAKKLASGCRIVYSGRLLIGVPMMMMGNPDMGDTEWYQQHVTGQDKEVSTIP
jgi:hypothetical protein